MIKENKILEPVQLELFAVPKSPRSNKLTKNKLAIIIVTIIAIISIRHFLHQRLIINLSSSLPYKLFFATFGKLPNSRDQIFLFTAKNNILYQADQVFIKRVGGLPGDVITIKDHDFYINNQRIGKAKEYALEGQKLTMASIACVIPKGKYFAYTSHKDSYDSKYQEIGLIDEKNIIGTAVVLF